MPQMFPQLEPPSKSNTTKKVDWSGIIGLLGAIIGFVSIILGTIHIIDFNWLMTILGCVMLVITIFIVIDNRRTKRRFQEQYNKDLASSQAEYQKFRQHWESYFDNERFRWDDWAVDFSRQSGKEHRERTEELKLQCMEAISDAEQRIDSNIKNAQSIFTSSVKSYELVVDQYRQQLINAMRRIDALEKRLDEKVTSDKEQ